MTPKYIPSNNNEFMAFQGNLNNEVTANAATWNIPATEASQLTTWSTGYTPLFNAIVNKNARTREQVIAHNLYRKDYEQFLRSFCQAFLTNNPLIPMSERVALGLNPRGLNPPTKRPKITTAPIPSMLPLGGGMMRFSFKVEASDKRVGRHPDSNGVELYATITGGVPGPSPIVLNDGLVEEETVLKMDADDTNPHVYFSTRAQFVAELGLSNIGKTIAIYARWVNTTNPNLSGPYSVTISRVIS